MDHAKLISRLQQGDTRALSRAISLVESEAEGALDILEQLRINHRTPVVGITGPPGAGKSTLLNTLLDRLGKDKKKVGIVAVDPSSPFNFGALLGDRVRLHKHYTNANVYIRSLASRGSLGGLSDKIMEVVDVMRAADFDYIFIETVGVGQSEVEVAGVADTTVVVLVPGAGDDIQTMKAGLMEIADIFVVNKADHPDANRFVRHLKKLVHSHARQAWKVPVLPTTATKGEGTDKLLEQIHAHTRTQRDETRQLILLSEKAWTLISRHRMRNLDKNKLAADIEAARQQKGFNLYRFLRERYVYK